MIENPTSIYVARHGETDWNRDRKIQGRTDIPLNDEGERQAGELGTILKDVHFDKVFSSDLLRAHRTAEIVTLERELAIQATHVLTEGDMGVFEGTSFDDFFPLFNEWKRLSDEEKKKHPRNADYETVETGDSIASRFITFLREVAIAYRGQSVLMISHAAVIANFLRHMGYKSDRDYIHVGNTAYIQIESDGIEFEVKHMEGIGL